MFEELTRQLNNIFTEEFMDTITLDVIETKKGYKVIAELAGYEKQNISLTYEDGYLTIFAKGNTQSNDANYLLKERFSGDKKRSIYLPEIDTNSIAAKFDSGLLTIETKLVEKNITKISIE